MRVLVIGSGIVGLATALQLQMEGLQVALADPNEPASGCSSGNAGYLSEAGIFPPAAIGGLRKIPSMLLDPDGPLVIRPTYIPKFIPWGIQAALANTPKRLSEIVAAQASLTRLALESYEPLLKEASAEGLVEQKGSLIVFLNKATFEQRIPRIKHWIDHGMLAEKLDPGSVLALEPNLSPKIVGGIFFPRAARCLDPRELGEHFARRIAAGGGIFHRVKVLKLERSANGEWLAIGDGHEIRADRVVVAAGRWSDELLRPLGHRFHIEAERGYHLMLPNPNVTINRPLSLAERNFAATPMKHGLRLAGTAEFAGTDAPMNPRRADMLLELAESYMPGICGSGAIKWMGARPSLPDMLPAIGQSSRHRGLFYCFGHNHNGLTQAAVSARLMADLILDRTPLVDPTPFSLDRFGAFLSRRSATGRAAEAGRC